MLPENGKLKDIVVRAAKTFVQAFIASIAVANITDSSNLKAVLVAAVAAGVSAVWNTLILANKVRKDAE